MSQGAADPESDIRRDGRTELVLLGAGATALEAFDLIAALNAAGGRFDVVAALDEDSALHGGYLREVPVVGGPSGTRDYPEALFVDTFGTPATYPDRSARVQALGIPRERFAILVHPQALVSPHAWLHPGALIFAFAVVSAGTSLGRNTRVHPHAVVHAGASVGDWTILESHAVVAAGVRIGRGCHVGAGAVIEGEVSDGTAVAPRA